MIPAQIPVVKMYRGDTLRFPGLTFLRDGEPMDLTGHTLTAQWRRSEEAPVALDIDVTVADPTSGQVALVMAAGLTASVTGDGVWDLQSAFAGEVNTLARGTTTLIKDVTHD